MARLDALTFVLALAPLVACQFYTPLPSREVYHVGEIKTIKYHTELINYTIVLWQQSMAGGSADPGPIVFQTTNGPQSEFNWTVQLYDFDLKKSNTFFFWLKEGGPENIGATKGKLMSSAYFYITDAPLPKSQSSPTTTSSSSSSASSSADSSSSFSSSLPSSDTTSSSLQTELSTMLPPESSASSPTGTDSSSTSAATQDQEETATGAAGSESSGRGGGGDLPVAAQVGIGVGVSIFGLTVIVCGILGFRYLRKQQKVLAELRQRVSSQPPDGAAMWKMQQYPFELAAPDRPGPPRAELS
ncbi:uncharacterized protein P884DRAFT_303464 [Thermothelomyces heterothallicus CBS 202.75]|uniref:uncharacterized protein n=1 Tax=Thermothelomyces heterothallicus CBS 202.75 TaxID=1149848 RepID=UPI003744ADF4